MKFIFAIIASFLLLSLSIGQSQITPISPGQKVPFSIGFTNSGAIATGKQKGYYTALVACTIVGYNISVDTGTVTVKTWKRAAGTAVPTIANLISTSGVSLSSGTHIESTTVSDFTTVTVAAGDIFCFDITAISGPTEISFALKIMPVK